MAEKIPARFVEWAPRMVRDLMRDFGLQDFQAAGVVGNGGEESGGFETMQELHPDGGRGGLGAFQWTGSRRVNFEAWLERPKNKAKGWTAHVYEANYSFLWRELTGPYYSAISALKQTKDIEQATRIFCELFEKPRVPAYDVRYKYAKWALTLYRGMPAPSVPPSVPPADLEKVTAMINSLRSLNPEQAMGLFRDIFKYLGMLAAAYGYATDAQWALYSGPLLSLAMTAWSVWSKNDKNLIISASNVPAVERVVAHPEVVSSSETLTDAPKVTTV